MMKYHKKGDPANVLGILYVQSSSVEGSGTGKLDLTSSLTEIHNSKGAINIDIICVHTYRIRNSDRAKTPSVKLAVVPCDFTTTATDSVKFGNDTKATKLTNER